MKIAHVLWSLKTGGMENMTVDIASIQAETEDIALFVINDEIEQYLLDKLSKKVKLYLIKRKSGSKNIYPLLKLNWLMLKFQPDIIHHHADNTVKCFKIGKKIPKVRTIHDLLSSGDDHSSYVRTYAISNTVKEHMASLGIDCYTIWNGINTRSINVDQTNLFVDHNLHFIQIGRLQKEIKGQDIVISAIRKVRDLGLMNYRMHFVGEGESMSELRDQVQSLGLSDLIVFEGRLPQQEIYKNLVNYDLLIMASRSEGFGLTLAEAMVAKVPVLCCDLAATMEVIDSGRLGSYFKSEDSDELANKIIEFINKGRDEDQVINAQTFALDNYDVRVTAQRYLSEYYKIIS